MENNSSFNPQIEESLASNFSFLNLQQLKNPSEFSSNYYSLLVKLHSLIFENVPFAKVRQFVEENQLQVNDVDCFGCSALHYAALSPEKNGDKEYSRNKEMIVGYLLSKKALPFQPQKIISQKSDDRKEISNPILTENVFLLSGNEVYTQSKGDRNRFESVKFHYGVAKGKWYYEVTLISGGLFQIGWFSSESKFNSQEGEGVGDEIFSFAFDGHRKKKWNKGIPSDYGEFWKKGDVISCCIDMDNQEILFGINGINYGIAFKAFLDELDPSMKAKISNIYYYPAVSLDEHQHCIFNFGEKPFVYHKHFSGFQPLNLCILNYFHGEASGNEVYLQVNSLPPLGGTPLHFALYNNNNVVALKLFQKLEEHNKLDLDYFGYSILDYMIEKQNHILFQTCINHSDFFFLKNGEQREKTLLHKCATIGNSAWCSELLKIGFDINYQDENEWTPLDFAVFKGHLSCVQKLLELGASVTGCDIHGSTVLFKALSYGNTNNEISLQMISLLLAKGADINHKDKSGCSPILLASFLGLKDIVIELWKQGANLNAEDINGFNILHRAVMYGNIEVIQFLLSQGLDINSKNSKDSTTPLSVAVQYPPPVCLEFLIQNGADVNSVDDLGATPVTYAASVSSKSALEILIKHGAKLNLKEMTSGTPLHDSVWNGDFECCKYLIECGANLNSEDEIKRTPLHYAAKRGFADIIKLLLSNGAFHDAEDNTKLIPLHISSKYGHFECVKLLVEAKSNVNASNTSKLTPLHFASQSNEKITEYLIANGALVNAEDANGRTPLHHAALFNKVKVAQILVKAGAIIDKLDNATKYSPLQLAIKTNQYEVAQFLLEQGANPDPALIEVQTVECTKLLLKYGANPNINISNSRTPLHAAASIGAHDIMRILIEAGAAINHPNDNSPEWDFSPLHLAVRNGNLASVKLLISHNADIFAKDKLGTTPWEMANYFQSLDVAQYLYEIESARLPPPISGNLFTWGDGIEGQLGHGDCRNQLFPKFVQQTSNGIYTVACGKTYMFGIMNDGSPNQEKQNKIIVGWGTSNCGVLGATNKLLTQPTIFPFLTSESKVLQIGCGASHCLMLVKDMKTGNSKVYSWGSGEKGQLGLGENVEQVSQPTELPNFTHFPIVKIFSGFNLSFAVEGTGWVWQWGNSISSPLKMDTLSNRGVRSIACSEDWILVLSSNKTLFFVSFPKRLVYNDIDNVEAISCGIQHFAIKTANGALYIGNFQNLQKQLIPDIPPVVHVACGTYHTLFSTSEGDVYLLEGNKKPQKQKRFHSIISLHCGHNFSSVITEPEALLESDLAKLINSMTFSDICFLIENKKFYAHKIILSVRCKYFKTLFEENPTSDVIIMEQKVSYEAFYELMLYLYSDNVAISPQLVTELINLAKEYNLQRLVSICEKEFNSSHIEIPPSTLASDILKALENPLFNDVKFVVNEKKIVLAHKAILSCRSSYFLAMFEGGMKESREKEIPLVGIDKEVLQILFHYLYSDELLIEASNAVEIISAANHFRMDLVKSKCEKKIQENWVDQENVCDLLMIADLYQALSLKKYCIQYIQEFFSSILSQELLKLPLEMIEDSRLKQKLSFLHQSNNENS